MWKLKKIFSKAYEWNFIRCICGGNHIQSYLISFWIKCSTRRVYFKLSNIYEPNALEKLIKHNKDIVGAVYATKYEEQKKVIEYFGKEEEVDAARSLLPLLVELKYQGWHKSSSSLFIENYLHSIILLF